MSLVVKENFSSFMNQQDMSSWFIKVYFLYTRRNEQRRKYSKMDKMAKDKLVRSPRENGGG